MKPDIAFIGNICRLLDGTRVYNFIKHHYQQIDLFYYQNNRKIDRPKTTYLDVIVWCLLFLFIIAICVTLNVIINLPTYYEVPVSIIVYLLVLEFSLKFIGIKVIECYQHYATEETRRNCLCVPSCSEYAILCLKKFELIYALLKISKRLFFTCKGFDYIIDDP